MNPRHATDTAALHHYAAVTTATAPMYIYPLNYLLF